MAASATLFNMLRSDRTLSSADDAMPHEVTVPDRTALSRTSTEKYLNPAQRRYLLYKLQPRENDRPRINRDHQAEDNNANMGCEVLT